MANIGAIILAAGGSSRLGEAKQLLTFPDGETLVHSAVRAAKEGGCKIVCVVTGETDERVVQAVADLHPIVVRNEKWSRGIGSSIRLGVQQLAGSELSAIVLLACDQLALDAAIVRALIARHEETGKAIVASHYGDTLGIPALFDRSCLGDLQRLPDDKGAKSLIKADAERVALIEFPEGALDLDSPADVRTWRARCSTEARR
jgi:molybdenum cofactor cytidylyltransferase